MCENVAKITFCICEVKREVVHNQNSRRNAKNKPANEPKTCRWSLHKITGLSRQTMDGLLIEPDHQFNEYLTSESILKEMNERNCFDFDYEPVNGDSFEIFESSGGSGKFMSFLFENDSWNIGSPNPFTHQITKFNSGNVCFE